MIIYGDWIRAQVQRNSGVTLFLERRFAHCGVFAVDCSGVNGFVGHKDGSVVRICAGKSLDEDPMTVLGPGCFTLVDNRDRLTMNRLGEICLRNCEIYLIAGRAAFEGGSWEHGGFVCAGCTTTQVTFEE